MMAAQGAVDDRLYRTMESHGGYNGCEHEADEPDR